MKFKPKIKEKRWNPEIEKKLNELSKATNTEAEGEVSDKDGKTGDIRTTRNKDGTYTFEIKTKEGWKTPALGDSLIKFKDKLSSFRQTTPKGIEDIVTIIIRIKEEV